MKKKKRDGLTFHQKQKKKFNIQLFYEILSWVAIVFAAVFLAYVGIAFFGIKTSMVGSSMEPILCNSQEVLINRVSYSMSAPKRFDVIVFKPNGNKNSHFYIKRVIGLPGETIQISGGKVYINGEVLKNDVADDTREGGVATNEIVLANDEYFVLGDNRSNSEDSRSANVGNVKVTMIEGKAWMRLKCGSYDKRRIE
ncbi:MAG: signal peptidase I [Lachnospiraceae bacterium]|nr:signal peptidase I [Lachnospiraceae bacterium]